MMTNPAPAPRRSLPIMVVLALVTGMFLPGARLALAQAPDGDDPPAVSIDALEGYRWSDESIIAAPGQTLVVTNRDVDRHSFAVDEWGLDQNLPTLAPVHVTVPIDADIGSSVTFYSSIADDRERGMEGTIHIVPRDEAVAGQDINLAVSRTVQDRLAIEVRDDFSFTPSSLDVEPGAFLEIRNAGVIEHHFVVDEWSVNETIPAGDIAIVQVPEDATPGETLEFYCSVPGHQAQGMTGSVRVVPRRASVGTISPDSINRVEVGKDLRPFVPDAAFLGSGWSQVRSGDAASLLPDEDVMSPDIFPAEGLGAIYVGPEGSRVTLIVLPLTERSLPANQVRDAMDAVQETMMETWNRDRITSAAYTDAAPPSGCDVAYRASGMVPVLTIPAGATACQMRSAGVAIFVTVEGSLGDASGVAAADEVIALLLTRSETTVAADES